MLDPIDPKREEIRKAAEAHAALLKEKLEAVAKLAADISANAATMDLKDLSAKLDQLTSLGWKLEDPARVVNVLKAEGGILPKVTEAQERLLSIQNKIKDLGEGSEFPADLLAEIKAIKELLAGVEDKYPNPESLAKAANKLVSCVADAEAKLKALKDKLAGQNGKPTPEDLKALENIQAAISGTMEKYPSPKSAAKKNDGAAPAPAANTPAPPASPAGTQPPGAPPAPATAKWPPDMAGNPSDSKNPAVNWGHKK